MSNPYEIIMPGAFGDTPMRDVPFKDKPNGATIGAATVIEDAMGLQIAITLNPGITLRVCDQCGNYGACLANGDHHICVDCQAQHEKALDAAVERVRISLDERNLSLSEPTLQVIVAAAVNGYLETT